MARKVWFEVWGQGPAHDKPVLLARVKSEGLSKIVANELRKYYKNVTVK